jgi:hypothetical protein
MAAFIADGVPKYEIRNVPGSAGMLVNNSQLGASLAQALGDKAVALMRGHGVVIVGPGIPETVSRGIFLDINARTDTGDGARRDGLRSESAGRRAPGTDRRRRISAQLAFLETAGNGKVGWWHP